MNWQLLNPIKLFGVTASLAGRFAPHATKKRLAIAAALGLAGVGGAGAYYWWKKPRGEPARGEARVHQHARAVGPEQRAVARAAAAEDAEP